MRTVSLSVSIDRFYSTNRIFLLIDGTNLSIQTYDGRQQCLLKLPGQQRIDSFSQQTIALSNDCVAIIDRVDKKLIHLFDTISGKTLGDGKIQHNVCCIVNDVDDRRHFSKK